MIYNDNGIKLDIPFIDPDLYTSDPNCIDNLDQETSELCFTFETDNELIIH